MSVRISEEIKSVIKMKYVIEVKLQTGLNIFEKTKRENPGIGLKNLFSKFEL
jgi:hypothetical protein